MARILRATKTYTDKYNATHSDSIARIALPQISPKTNEATYKLFVWVDKDDNKNNTLPVFKSANITVKDWVDEDGVEHNEFTDYFKTALTNATGQTLRNLMLRQCYLHLNGVQPTIDGFKHADWMRDETENWSEPATVPFAEDDLIDNNK